MCIHLQHSYASIIHLFICSMYHPLSWAMVKHDIVSAWEETEALIYKLWN